MINKRHWTGLAVACLAMTVARGDTVSFTLTFADRPVPDMRGYEALWLTGEGFRRDNDLSHGGETYGWFAVPVRESGLPWRLTYDGYADVFCHDANWVGSLGQPGMTADAVLNKTIKLWRSDEAFWRQMAEEHHEEPKPPTWALYHLLSSMAGHAPDGAPHSWDLPDLAEEGCPAVVRNGLFYDLTARFGTPEAKKRILVVSSEYDWGKRFCLGYRVPTLGFEKEKTAFRQVYKDGVNGATIAELQVKYPHRFLGGGFHRDRSESYFKPAVLTFVLKELQNQENRGKTIRGTYSRQSSQRLARVLRTDGSTFAAEQRWLTTDRIEIEGREKPAQSADASVVFDGRHLPANAYANWFQFQFTGAEIPAGVKTIGACAFSTCEMFGYEKGTVSLPEGLESIGAGAFRGCMHLAGIEIPDSVTNIGAWAFCECSNLKSVRLPKNLTEIADGLFYKTAYGWGTKELERIELPSGVRRIGKYAFSGCVELKEVAIPDSVEEIDDYAFYGCKALVRPKLSPSVRLGRHVFE